MILCENQLKADDRVNTVTCNRPGASLVQAVCPRLGHVETVHLCQRCMGVILYCQPCFEADRILVRSSLLIAA